MAIQFVCSACGSTLRVGDDAAGRTVRCGRCLATMLAPPLPVEESVPYAESAPPAPAPARPRAEPVAPPLHPPRHRRKSKPTSVRTALLVSFLILGVVVVLCCGGVYIGGRPDWQMHDSDAGGFRVELPGSPRSDMHHWAGIKNDPNVKIEGTILFLRLEDYGVVYADIDPVRRARFTDDAIIDEALNGMKADLPGTKVVRSEPVTVSGFPGREVVVESPDVGTAVGRIVVAETRLYIAITGGRFADPDNERARRFLDSFEITDQKLIDRHKGRVAQRVAKEAERQQIQERAKQRDEQARQEAAERRAAEAKQNERFRQLEEQRREERLAAEKKRQEELLAARKKAEEERLAREKAEREADEKDRSDAEAFRTAKYTGGAVPDPNALPGLVLYLSFDDAGGGTTAAAPSGRALGLPPKAAVGPGVRGPGLTLLPGCDGIEIPAAILPRTSTTPSTVAGWVRVRTARVGVFNMLRRPAAPTYSLSASNGQIVAFPHLRSNAQLPDEGTGGVLSAGWIADTEWHHVALVRDTEVRTITPHKLILYFDGKPVRTVSGTFLTAGHLGGTTGQVGIVRPPPPGGRIDREWQLGAAARHPDRPVAAIDEVCVFDRPLTAHEVRYLAGREPDPTPRPTAPPPRAK